MQWTRAAAQAMRMVSVVVIVAGCTLPRSGPTANEILSAGDNPAFNVLIVDVTPAVAAVSRDNTPLGFGSDLTGPGAMAADVISAGDTLSITVWENVDDGLLAGLGQNVTALDQIQVDESGQIFMPYVGRVTASGQTPDQLRADITASLQSLTPDPQVEVRRIAGNGATVSVLGDVATPGVYPIETPTRRLSAMLARAGGVRIVPDVAQVKIERRGRSERIWLQDLYDQPRYDIALRPGDRIIVEQDRRTFTALGATEGQARVNFSERDMSAIGAIAAAGGLDGNAADPTGIFVFRNENAEVANRVSGRTDLIGPQRVAYVMNLTKPEGMFAAREFIIRDEDTVYITEAPFTAWRQIIAITGTVVALGGSVAAIAN
jgi:polysaccharide biosynthesis/export protein